MVTLKVPPANKAPATPAVPLPNATLLANVMFVSVLVEAPKMRTAPPELLAVFDEIVEFCNVTLEPKVYTYMKPPCRPVVA